MKILIVAIVLGVILVAYLTVKVGNHLTLTGDEHTKEKQKK